jgi:cobalt/nickel transport system ATP-binding protein
MESLIKVQCIKHIYPDKTEVNLCGLDFIVNEGERIVILGSNGSGKTTLLAHILGLLSPVHGTVEVMGLRPDKNFNSIRKSIGVVFQNIDEQIIGPTVFDDIAFTPRNEGLGKKEVQEKVMNIAKMLEIEDILDKIPHYLSGGQRKKVALAGALVMMPRILILDEPFDSLDPKSKTSIIKVINELNKKHGITVITTTHDINIVSDIADRIYVINKSEIVTNGTFEEVITQVQTLEKANLEPPILTDLFLRLRSRGYDIHMPRNTDDAEEQLIKLLEKIAVHRKMA